MKKIIINGRVYNSIEEVPELLRHFVKDENKDGVPDIAEKSESISFNGMKLGDISTEEREKIMQMVQKAPQLLKNPMLGAIIKGVSGLDPDEIVNKINTSINETPSKTSSTHEIISTTEPKSPIRESRAQFQPPSSFQPGVKKDSGRNFLVLAAIIGFIGWLLYSYTEIL